MPNLVNKKIWNWIIYCLIFSGGFILGKIVVDIPYLSLDTEVGIGDIANSIIAVVVAVLIPISLSPILSNKRAIKDFLINEVKDCTDFLTSIKTLIDDMSIKNNKINEDRIKINSMIARDLGMKIGSIADQLETSFKNKCPKLTNNLRERYNEYWREVTGGELMSQDFEFNLIFKSMHDKNYSKLQATLKKAIHEINNY